MVARRLSALHVMILNASDEPAAELTLILRMPVHKTAICWTAGYACRLVGELELCPVHSTLAFNT